MTPPRELRNDEKQLCLGINEKDLASFMILSRHNVDDFPFFGLPLQEFWRGEHVLKFCTSKYSDDRGAYLNSAEIPSSHRHLYMNSWAVVDAGRLVLNVTERRIIVHHGSDTFYDLKGSEDRVTTRALLEKAIRESPHLAGWTIEDRE